MAHDLKRQVAHAIHGACHTDAGKKMMETAAATAAAASVAVLGPVAGPVVLIVAAGWGLWRVFKK